MARDEKYEEAARHPFITSAAASNTYRDQAVLKKQNRTLRLFSRSQLFAL